MHNWCKNYKFFGVIYLFALLFGRSINVHKMAHSFNEIVQHHDHYIDEYNKIDKKKHLPLVNLSFFHTTLTKWAISLLHLKKGCLSLGKDLSVRAGGNGLTTGIHPKPSLYCIQTKRPNVQCHKDFKIQWDATSMNVPEQSNKLFKRTCWNGQTMLIHERFCHIPDLNMWKLMKLFFCTISR